MTVVRMEINKAGFRELRTSAGVHRILEGEADPIAGRANGVPSSTNPASDDPYYVVRDGSDEERARKRVVTANPRAMRHEARTQALQRSV